eukprot:TRINITY_DN19738_c0_g1_i1.p1 TRINITY_DN19738_c0_g1~~TRINITY_DN19738_c0_g1_i1.p1  ORF type:complete len:378 (+),score=57.59 TRINITY_DN19738_c0_g1_i1:107-1240(+)
MRRFAIVSRSTRAAPWHRCCRPPPCPPLSGRRLFSSRHDEPPQDADPVLPMKIVKASQKVVPFIGQGGYLMLASGFLMTDPLYLRSLLVCGYSNLVAFHSLQYRPLRIPLMGSVFFVFVNAYFAAKIIKERFVSLTGLEASIYAEHFESVMSKYDFKCLMEFAEVRRADTKTLLVKKGTLADLVIIIDGEAEVDVGGNVAVALRKGGMIGEISCLQGCRASATVTALEGCRYIVWDREALSEFFAKPEAANAKKGIELKVGRELARKLAATTSSMVQGHQESKRQHQMVRMLEYESAVLRHLFTQAYSPGADKPGTCELLFVELEKYRKREAVEQEMHEIVIERRLNINVEALIREKYSAMDVGRLVSVSAMPHVQK